MFGKKIEQITNDLNAGNAKNINREIDFHYIIKKDEVRKFLDPRNVKSIDQESF